MTPTRTRLLSPSTLAVALGLTVACHADEVVEDGPPGSSKVSTEDGPSLTQDQNRGFEVGCGGAASTCTWDERVRAAIDADEHYDRPIASPVMGVELQDGKVPAWEVKDDLSGRRYVEKESVEVDEDGTTRQFSGLETIAHWRPSQAELHELADAQRATGRGLPTASPPATHDPISPLLRPRLAAGDPNERVQVSVSVRKLDGFSISAELQKAIGRGGITVRGELRHARVDAVKEWQTRVASQQSKVEAEAAALGGRVLHRFQNLHRVDIDIELGAIERLAHHPDVTRVEPADLELTPHAVGGVARDRASQLNQFLSAGYDGEMGSGGTDDLVAAVVELGGLQRGHVGFWDTGAGASRLVWAFDCTGAGGCISHNYDWPTHDPHASGVAGVLVGDLMDGQDAAFASPTDRQNRSGVSRESRFYFYRAGSAAWDDVPLRPRHVHVVNNSWGNDEADQQCLGQDGISQASNDLFLLGHLPVNSAGNCTLDDTDCDDDFGCTVNSPASSMGSLTVGGTDGHVAEGDWDALRVADIYGDQSIGGVSWAEGRDRPIIDISAPACYKHTYLESANSGTDAYLSLSTKCGTSYSTPAVAGALLDFIDHYKTVAAPGSTTVDNPATLHAFALLFGDRQGGVDHGPVDLDDRMTGGLSHMWGAGRLKLRRLDGAGMDTPYAWARLSTCIDDGEIYLLPLGTPSADVETVKVATYFYDPFHESGSNVAKIDAYLKADTSYVALDYLGRNEARRLFHDDAGGKELTLVLHGQDVSGTDSEGCGANSRRVHIVWFSEDSDRDDADGQPCWDDPACSTYEIEPEDLYPTP